eukprot:Lankesteria_metandrocarpae@DN2627_c0_g1_i1.p1
MLPWVGVAPNQTLYCNNLNDKIKVEDLKSNIFEFFCPYGEILDVVAWMGQRHRGQAFVVFKDTAGATHALRTLNGKNFLGKAIRVNYAKSKSDVAALADGTFKPRKKLEVADGDAKIGTTHNSIGQHTEGMSVFGGTTGVTNRITPAVECGATLFVEGLPDAMTESAMATLFGQYPGFIEARLIAGRHICFVDFESDAQAAVALKGLDGFLVTADISLKISVANRGTTTTA